jgi:TonB family protein
MKKTKLIVFLALSALCALGQSQPSLPTASSAGATPHRVQVDADTASALVIRKGKITYPDEARRAGIQGAVVLRVVISNSGDVTEVAVVSGDPALTEPAAKAMKEWKYKPYQVDGSPVEMETQVSISFQITPPRQRIPPPVGTSHDDTYSNDYFGISYPLSRDWVRETDLMRSKIASEGNSGTYVILAAIHIPQDTDPLRADSSLVVEAANRSATPSSQDCSQYLQAMNTNLHSQQEGKQKGDAIQLTIAGHDFYRANFEYRHGVDHGTVLCTSIKDYMLRWHIVGWSKQAIETAVSTLSSLTPAPPTPLPTAPQQGGNQSVPKQVLVSPGVTTGLLIKKVAPVYPQEAKNARIQGSVVLRAAINKTGDIVDLEVISGPIELVVSAVNAVRKWKYRPYLLMGEPVEVQTQIVVNYVLQF